jgi:hypothetical protein
MWIRRWRRSSAVKVRAFLHGEGKTDLGQVALGTFEAGPCYRLLEQASQLELEPSYRSKHEIAKVGRHKVSLPGVHRGLGTALYFKNALVLAILAQQSCGSKPHLCVLFRDSDGTQNSSRNDWQNKFDSIIQGFKAGNCDTGVALLPRPKSEAWMLCALRKDKSQHCQALEERSGNDASPNSLKAELAKVLISQKLDSSAETLNQLIRDEKIHHSHIKIPSFESFLATLRTAEQALARSL